jgi:hypothetical protein
MTNTTHDDSKSVPVKGPEIKRYSISPKCDRQERFPNDLGVDVKLFLSTHETQHENGEWVRYSDHLADRAADKAEIERLHERLEDNHFYVDDGSGNLVRKDAEPGSIIPDGIECRDETIKLQDEAIARLRTQVEGLREALSCMLDAHNNECWLDHNGNCQAHFVEPTCRVALARRVLELVPPPADTEKEG